MVCCDLRASGWVGKLRRRFSRILEDIDLELTLAPSICHSEESCLGWHPHK